jgi:hypothetical protein
MGMVDGFVAAATDRQRQDLPEVLRQDYATNCVTIFLRAPHPVQAITSRAPHLRGSSRYRAGAHPHAFKMRSSVSGIFLLSSLAEAWTARLACTTREPNMPYGPTVLVSVLVGPMIRHTILPVPSGAQDGAPTPLPPTFSQPVQVEPL